MVGLKMFEGQFPRVVVILNLLKSLKQSGENLNSSSARRETGKRNSVAILLRIQSSE